MKLAVLLARDTDNPKSLPPAWPVKVMELRDADPMPKAPWIEMTRKQYDDYRAVHQSKYDAWDAADRKALEDAEAAKEAERKQRLDNIKSRLGLSDADIEIIRGAS